MVEAKLIARWVALGLCLLSLGLLITSFIFAIYARFQVNEFKENYQSIITSWDQDMVFDLSLSAGSVMGSGNPDYSITEWGSNWPGNNAGCYCSSSNEALEVAKGLTTGSCNGNQTEAGCN